MNENRMNAWARETIRGSGMSVAAFKRSYFEDGRWHGDECGCTDDRCIGFHHDAQDECGCLPVLIRDAHLRAVPAFLHLITPQTAQGALAALTAAWQRRLDAVWHHTRIENEFWNGRQPSRRDELLVQKVAAWEALMKASEDVGVTFYNVCRALSVDHEQVTAQVARILAEPVKEPLTPEGTSTGAPTDD